MPLRKRTPGTGGALFPQVGGDGGAHGDAGEDGVGGEAGRGRLGARADRRPADLGLELEALVDGGGGPAGEEIGHADRMSGRAQAIGGGELRRTQAVDRVEQDDRRHALASPIPGGTQLAAFAVGKKTFGLAGFRRYDAGTVGGSDRRRGEKAR